MIFTVLGAAVLLALIMALVGWFKWEKRKPDESLHGIDIRYLPGALKPWTGLPQAVGVMWEVLLRRYPAAANKVLHHTWIEVVPYKGRCLSPRTPSGFFYSLKSGREERVKVTSRIEEYLWSQRFLAIVCRQLRAGDTPVQDTLAAGQGTTLSAGESLLFHELAQHVVPFRMFGDWNAYHNRPELEALELEMGRRYAEIMVLPAPRECARCHRP